MVNQEKIRIMAQLASYEQNEGKKDFAIVRRMRGDYVSHKSFLNCFYVTIALILIFLVSFGQVVMEHMTNLTDYDFVSDGMKYLIIWVLFMLVYLLVGGRVYRKEYDSAKNRVMAYEKQLKQLDEFSKK